jgi:uncharacterized protein YdeI (YjbR/CyaY-like superfamily)
MSAKSPPTDLPIHSFSTATDLENFLQLHHTTAPGFHLKLSKKGSGIPSVSGAEAVETALCFGWIDGRANGLDANHWLLRFTPRRPKSSIWSQKNVATVARLIEQGRMRPAGLAAVETAKADGRWDAAYAGPATMSVADDFALVLEGRPAAKALFEGMNKSERYSVLWRVETASVKARAGRIEALVQMLDAGKKPGETAKVKAKTKAATSKSNPGAGVQKKTSIAKTARAKKIAPISDTSDGVVQSDQTRQSRREGLRKRA